MTGEGRLADRALVLTVATFVLLTPPILGIFDVSVPIFGLPALHVYCFAVWLVVIALGAMLASRLARLQPDYRHTGGGADDPAGDA